MDLVKGTYDAHSTVFATSYEKTINTIELGIEKEFLKKITIVGKREEKIINRLVIEIDWEKHRVLCETQSGTFEFNSGSSISDQVSGALAQLSTFVKNSITGGYINKITMHYRYRSDVDHMEANAALGLVNISEIEVNEIGEFEGIGMQVEVRPERLPELLISFQSRTTLDGIGNPLEQSSKDEP